MEPIFDTSNKILESAEPVIATPRREDIGFNVNNEELVARLNSIASPNERLFNLIKSIVDFGSLPTHESTIIRNLFLLGGLGGFVFGGALFSPEVHQNYQRTHNSAVFEGKYVGNRHFWDTLVTGCASKGMRYGLRTSLLAGTAGIIGFSSIVYRNHLHYPDFLVGFTIFGAASRFWLGPRAMLIGGVVGALAGSFGWGCLRLNEIFTGLTITQTRLLYHQQYLCEREEKHRKFLIAQEQSHVEHLKQNQV